MGTYINIDAEFSIKKINIEPAMQALKDLNKRDELKRGGSSSGQKWFSWVDEHYDQKVKTLNDVICGELGFELYVEEDNGETMHYEFNYYNKWGQHEVFFITLGKFCESMSLDHFCDELEYPNQRWKLVLDPNTKTMHQIDPVIDIEWPECDEENEVVVDSFVVRY